MPCYVYCVSVTAAVLRLSAGFFFAVLYTTASHVFPSSFLVSDEYMVSHYNPLTRFHNLDANVGLSQ